MRSNREHDEVHFIIEGPGSAVGWVKINPLTEDGYFSAQSNDCDVLRISEDRIAAALGFAFDTHADWSLEALREIRVVKIIPQPQREVVFGGK